MHLIEDHASRAGIPIRFAASRLVEGDEQVLAHLQLSDNEKQILEDIIDVGRHRVTLEQFHAIVAGKSRSDAGESMPGNALFLEEVEY